VLLASRLSLSLSLSRKARFELWQYLYAGVIGLVLFVIQGYVFGYLNCRFLTYVYLFVCLVLAWMKRRELLAGLSLCCHKKLPIVLWLIIGLGVLSQLVPVFLSGVKTDDSIVFYFLNGFDGIFHLGLTRSLTQSVPPVQPGAVGLLVTNYHYFSNLVVAELARIFHLPITHLYFQYIPLFMSFYFAVLIIYLCKLWCRQETFVATSVLGLILYYFVGEMSWLVNIVLGTYAGFSTMSNLYIDHSMVQFLNPPQAFAKLVFLALLFFLHRFWKERKLGFGIISAVLIAALFGFKIYFGVAAVLGLTLTMTASIFGKFAEKDERLKYIKKCVCVYGVVGILSLLFFLPTNHGSGGLFFDFLTWPKLLTSPDRLNWSDWWLRLWAYEEGGSIKGQAYMYALLVAVFLFSIYHLRLAGLFLTKKWRGKMLGLEVVFLLSISISCVILGMNFLQVSGGANTFNFTVIALTVLNLATSVVLGEIVTRHRWVKCLGFGLAIFTLVQGVCMEFKMIRDYYRRADRMTISSQENRALRVLRELPVGSVVQSLPGSSKFDDYAPYLYAFSGHFEYYGGRNVLQSHNQPIFDREILLNKMLEKLGADTCTATMSALKKSYTEKVAQQLRTLTPITHFYLDLSHDRDRTFFNLTANTEASCSAQVFETIYYDYPYAVVGSR
jgi:hypothetical protein